MTKVPAVLRRRPRRVWLAGIAVLVVAVGLTGWLIAGGGGESRALISDHPGSQLHTNPLPDPEHTGWHGALLDEPIPRPEFTLTDTEGRPYDIATETAGEPTLLYIGYTSCPDICPLHLSHIADALHELDGDGDGVEVVFVTADPERDDPATLERYLDAFHPSFVGLTGSEEEIAAALAAVGQPSPDRYNERDGGVYEVTHPSQVIAFSTDDQAHLVFPFGTSRDGWVQDLPRLVDGEVPSS